MWDLLEKRQVRCIISHSPLSILTYPDIRFKRVDYEEVEFNRLAEGTTGVETEELVRDNVAQIILLQDLHRYVVYIIYKDGLN